MKIIIKTIKNTNINNDLRGYLEEKIRKYENLVKEPAVCEATFEDSNSKGGLEKIVTITLTLPDLKNPISVCERTSDFFGSIDLAQEKLEQQLIKYKEKIKIGTRFPLKYYNAKLEEESEGEI